jgi:Fibrinogen beta and gamma chains, C-terminal globular domain
VCTVYSANHANATDYHLRAGFVAQNVTTLANISGTAVPLMSVSNWLSVMSRVDAYFPTSGVDYYSGFGAITENFWIGLTNLHMLTSPSVNGGRNYRLRFEMYAYECVFNWLISHDYLGLELVFSWAHDHYAFTRGFLKKLYQVKLIVQTLTALLS